jgi:hypothetical protein
VARAVWKPQPDLRTAAEAWLIGGGAHHTVLTQAIGMTAPGCRPSRTRSAGIRPTTAWPAGSR